MNIYLISQEVNNGYDTFDSAVVVAESEDEARFMHPGGGMYWAKAGSWVYSFNDKAVADNTWTTPNNVKVELIGTSINSTPGVICASFNAG